MPRTLRLAAVALLLVAAGCKSDNTGKIVGRWRAVLADTPVAPVDIVWEFAADGTFTVSQVETGPAGRNPVQVASGRYKLGWRDNVSFTNLDPPLDGKSRSSERIVIEGDTMTVGGRGQDRAYRFARVP